MQPDRVLDESLGGRRRKCAVRKNKGHEHLPREQRPHCGRPALPGRLYCLKHRRFEPERRAVEKLPQLYRLVSRSLQKRMDELEAQQEKRLSLLTELDLVRASADESVQQYGEARDLKELAEQALLQQPDEPKLKEALATATRVTQAAGENMRQTLESVKSFVLAAQHVSLAGKDQITPEMVRSVLNQCALLLYEVCGDEHEELAAEFEAKIYDRVTIGVEERVYTAPQLTIQHDVKRMMASVPECDDDDLDGG